MLGSALSDTEREGRIVFGSSSELNRLGDGADGDGEAVHLTSLDIERQRHGWGEIDFIKMDAEGEELKIIAGGRSVFEAGSPVVMFEIKSETGNDPRIAEAFSAMGYGLYRLLPDERHLVPFDEAELDGLELNLFAIRPERAEQLAAEGILALSGDAAPVIAAGGYRALAEGKPFFNLAPALFGRDSDGSDYMRGLDAYAAWRDETRPLAERYAALRQAAELVKTSVAGSATVASLISLARINRDIGQRVAAYDRVVDALKLMEAGATPDAPFVPPTLRHEVDIQDAKSWLAAGCLEAAEYAVKYSTFYAGVIPQLHWLCRTSYATTEMERRRALSAMHRGQPVQLLKNLGRPAPDHLNAETWAKLMGQ